MGIFGSTPYPVLPQFREKPGASWSWNLVNVLSPTITNEFIFTSNHLTQAVNVEPDADPNLYDKTKLAFTFTDLYPNANQLNKFPRFDCGVGTCGFSGFAAPWLSEGKTFAFIDNFTINRGAHTFKFGGLWNRNDNRQQPKGPDSPNVDFNTSNDNRWIPGIASPTCCSATIRASARAMGGDPFNGIIQEGSPGVPLGFAKHRYNNWSPRLGFAWDPFGDGQTSIRGGAAVSSTSAFDRTRQTSAFKAIRL